MDVSQTSISCICGLKIPAQQADEIRNEADELLRIRDYLFKELSKKAGRPVERILHDLSRMKCFIPKEALAYGLIDEIVRPSRIKGVMLHKTRGDWSWLVNF